MSWKQLTSHGYTWVPSVFFLEGLPFAVATSVSIVMFKSFGMSNGSIAFWTSVIAFPWSLKFLWAPFLDSVGTKRGWMLFSQYLLAASLGFLAVFAQCGYPLNILIAGFILLAFQSATHDIAADGYYMVALDESSQSVCSGMRNIFYKCATLFGQGGMVMIAGKLQQKNCSLHTAWTIALTTAALLTLIISVYHTFFIPAAAKKIEKKVFSGKRFVESFKTFFSRPGIWKVIFFLFFYRFAESQLGKMAVTFMITPVSDGGLGLTIEQQGEISGIVGTAAFWIGGLLAGWAVARFGFGKCIIPMVLALNVPDVLYLLMTWYIPNIYVISGQIALEQFGYGLGYSLYMIFMLQYSMQSDSYKTSHFALMTGITILGMNISGMMSGYIQEWLSSVQLFRNSYTLFFAWVCLCTVISYFAVYLIYPLTDKNYGKKQSI